MVHLANWASRVSQWAHHHRLSIWDMCPCMSAVRVQIGRRHGTITMGSASSCIHAPLTGKNM